MKYAQCVGFIFAFGQEIDFLQRGVAFVYVKKV
jgi:hypothetical protein